MGDHQINYALLPVRFTEVWIPISRTRELMNTLRDWFAKGSVERTGLFFVEIYAAAASKAWLGNASRWPGMEEAEPCVRVNVTQSTFSTQDPYAFFDMYWTVLKPMGFKLHKGKYAPECNGDQKWYRDQYPRWDDFLLLRKQMDPNDIFLSRYWSKRLGIKNGRIPEEVLEQPTNEVCCHHFFF